VFAFSARLALFATDVHGVGNVSGDRKTVRLACAADVGDCSLALYRLLARCTRGSMSDDRRGDDRALAAIDQAKAALHEAAELQPAHASRDAAIAALEQAKAALCELLAAPKKTPKRGLAALRSGLRRASTSVKIANVLKTAATTHVADSAGIESDVSIEEAEGMLNVMRTSTSQFADVSADDITELAVRRHVCLSNPPPRSLPSGEDSPDARAFEPFRAS
jgi:hypothetical protein